METTKQLNDLIANIPKNMINKMIDDNRLNLLVYTKTDKMDKKAHIEFVRYNRSRYIYNLYTLLSVSQAFQENGVFYIAFKGVILANKLYRDKTFRPAGDIDIYVREENFEIALNILYELGFYCEKPTDINNAHHVVLRNKFTVIELHRHILNPLIGIDETYLLDNTAKTKINKTQIKTFNCTATLLHLLYHLYMDTYLTIENKKFFFVSKGEFGIAKRFLFRAYEIALFSEKYSNEIKWKDIVEDIRKQKLYIMFKIMILDILKIFPNAFPRNVVDTISSINYVKDEKGVLYKWILDLNQGNKEAGQFLCNYIDNQWNDESYKKIQISKFGEFVLDNPVIKNKEIYDDFKLVCKACVEKTDEGVKLNFKVSNDDYCFSGLNDYNPQNSDGIHLIICGTEKYSYSSMFLFPKVINDQVVVMPIDILDDEKYIIDDTLVSSVYERLGKGYIITVTIKNKFLNRKNIKDYFYLGLIVSDCSNKTKKRKAELILSEPSREWGNPAYFAKIKLN